MAKNKPKLSPKARLTVAAYHRNAYEAGHHFAIQILEIVVGMQKARTGIFNDIDPSRFQPDMFFVRGFLDATVPLFGDTAPMMRTKFGMALQEAIMDDFFDNAEIALDMIRAREPHCESMSGRW